MPFLPHFSYSKKKPFSNKTIKNDSETGQRFFFNEGTVYDVVYTLTTKPRAFTTACILNSNRNVQRWNGVIQSRAVLYSLYSMRQVNYAAKIPLIVK